MNATDEFNSILTNHKKLMDDSIQEMFTEAENDVKCVLSQNKKVLDHLDVTRW